MSEGEKPRCSTKRQECRFAQPKVARRASAMDGASESLTLRHIKQKRLTVMWGVFVLSEGKCGLDKNPVGSTNRRERLVPPNAPEGAGTGCTRAHPSAIS